MRYSIEPRDRRHVKSYQFLASAKNIGRNMSNKYSKKLVDSAKKSATDAIKTIQKKSNSKNSRSSSRCNW